LKEKKMKKRRASIRQLLIFCLIPIILTVMLLLTCGDGENLLSDKVITAFKFLKADNPSLAMDILGVIDEQTYTIYAYLPDETDYTNLIATFEKSAFKITVGGVEQESGVTANDFTDPVVYTVEAFDKTTQDFTVDVMYWKHPGDISDNISIIGVDMYAPQAAVDDAIIVWYQYDVVPNGGGFDYQIYKSVYSDQGWDHPDNADDNISPDFHDAADPQVAMDDNGNAIIVWSQLIDIPNGEFPSQIFMSEYKGGPSWDDPADIYDYISYVDEGQYDAFEAKNPQVAMSSNGDAVIVWQQYDDVEGNWQIFRSERRNGVWDHPSTISDNISPDFHDATDPQVAMDDNGNAIIVWSQLIEIPNGEYPSQIFMVEYRDGTWDPNPALDEHISYVKYDPPDEVTEAKSPQVAMSSTGEAVIVWQQYDTSDNWQIFMSEYRSGEWLHPIDFTDNISPDGQDAVSPQVAIGHDGSAVITWLQNYSGLNRIFKSEYR
jgi:hypothetical protein